MCNAQRLEVDVIRIRCLPASHQCSQPTNHIMQRTMRSISRAVSPPLSCVSQPKLICGEWTKVVTLRRTGCPAPAACCPACQQPWDRTSARMTCGFVVEKNRTPPPKTCKQ